MSFKKYLTEDDVKKVAKVLTEGRQGGSLGGLQIENFIPWVWNMFLKTKDPHAVVERITAIANMSKEDYSGLGDEDKRMFRFFNNNIPAGKSGASKEEQKQGMYILDQGMALETLTKEGFDVLDYVTTLTGTLKNIGEEPLVHLGNKQHALSDEWKELATSFIDNEALAKAVQKDMQPQAGKTDFKNSAFNFSLKKLGGAYAFKSKKPEFVATCRAAMNNMLVEDETVTKLIGELTQWAKGAIKLSDNVTKSTSMITKIEKEFGKQGLDFPKDLDKFESSQVADNKLKQLIDNDLSEYIELKDASELQGDILERITTFFNDHPSFHENFLAEALSGKTKFGEGSEAVATHLMLGQGLEGWVTYKEIAAESMATKKDFYKLKVNFGSSSSGKGNTFATTNFEMQSVDFSQTKQKDYAGFTSLADLMRNLNDEIKDAPVSEENPEVAAVFESNYSLIGLIEEEVERFNLDVDSIKSDLMEGAGWLEAVVSAVKQISVKFAKFVTGLIQKIIDTFKEILTKGASILGLESFLGAPLEIEGEVVLPFDPTGMSDEINEDFAKAMFGGKLKA